MGLLSRVKAAVEVLRASGPIPDAPTADFQMYGILPAASNEEYKGFDHKRDGAGNLFLVASVFQKANNNVTWLRVVKRSPQGAQMGAWIVAIPGNTKTVGNPKISNNGVNLTLSTGVYGMDSARISDGAYVEIPGVWVEATEPPPPPPPSGEVLRITAPASMAGDWRRA